MLAFMQRSEPPAISMVDTASGSRRAREAVLFVCMGNICRSPTADGLFRHKVQRYGLEDAVTVDSAGTHNFHPGSPPDVRSQDHAAQRGYDLSTLGARQIQASDFDQFDLILEMDWDNLGIWTVKAAERRVHEVVRSAGEQRAQAERELADTAETVDDLETKLDEVQATAEGLQTKLTAVQAASQAQAVELAQMRERLALTEQAAKAATEQHAAELARMNATVQDERTRHQQEAEQLRTELSEQKRATQAATAECDQAQKAAAEARERAAGLAGKIEAIQAQNTVMLARLTPGATTPNKAT